MFAEGTLLKLPIDRKLSLSWFLAAIFLASIFIPYARVHDDSVGLASARNFFLRNGLQLSLAALLYAFAPRLERGGWIKVPASQLRILSGLWIGAFGAVFALQLL